MVLDPLSIASQASRNTIERTAFLEAEAGGGFISRRRQHRLAGRFFRAGNRLRPAALQFLSPRRHPAARICRATTTSTISPAAVSTSASIRRSPTAWYCSATPHARQRVSRPGRFARRRSIKPNRRFKSRRSMEPHARREERHPGLRRWPRTTTPNDRSISSLAIGLYGSMTTRPSAASPAAWAT